MKKLFYVLCCLLPTLVFGTTRNIVPNGDGEGSMGASNLQWGAGYYSNLYVGNIDITNLVAGGTNISSSITNAIAVVVTANSNLVVGATNNLAANMQDHSNNTTLAHGLVIADVTTNAQFNAHTSAVGVAAHSLGSASTNLSTDFVRAVRFSSDALFAGSGTTGGVSSTGADAAKYLKGDGTWGVVSAGGGDVYLVGTNVFTGPSNTFAGTVYAPTGNFAVIVGTQNLGVAYAASASSAVSATSAVYLGELAGNYAIRYVDGSIRFELSSTPVMTLDASNLVMNTIGITLNPGIPLVGNVTGNLSGNADTATSAGSATLATTVTGGQSNTISTALQPASTNALATVVTAHSNQTTAHGLVMTDAVTNNGAATLTNLTMSGGNINGGGVSATNFINLQATNSIVLNYGGTNYLSVSVTMPPSNTNLVCLSMNPSNVNYLGQIMLASSISTNDGIRFGGDMHLYRASGTTLKLGGATTATFQAPCISSDGNVIGQPYFTIASGDYIMGLNTLSTKRFLMRGAGGEPWFYWTNNASQIVMATGTNNAATTNALWITAGTNEIKIGDTGPVVISNVTSIVGSGAGLTNAFSACIAYALAANDTNNLNWIGDTKKAGMITNIRYSCTIGAPVMNLYVAASTNPLVTYSSICYTGITFVAGTSPSNISVNIAYTANQRFTANASSGAGTNAYIWIEGIE